MLLLCTLYSIGLTDNDVQKLLHGQNTKGCTLLGLILHYQHGMMMPQTFLLQLEKTYHKDISQASDNQPRTQQEKLFLTPLGLNRTTSITNKIQDMKIQGQEDPAIKSTTMASLAECFRDNLKPSVEVLEALKEVEDSLPKTSWEKAIIYIKEFLSVFVIPFAVMVVDIIFDLFVVHAYSQYLYVDDDTVEDTELVDICRAYGFDPNVTQPVTRGLEHIPRKLNGRPRFVYSVGFLFVPWVFYCIEFCHSRHSETLWRKVSIFVFYFCHIDFLTSFYKNACNSIKSRFKKIGRT